MASNDRPIGIGVSGVAGMGGLASGSMLPRRAIVITREIVEAALTKLAAWSPAAAPPLTISGIPGLPPIILPPLAPGTLAIPLIEPPADDLQGQYILYIQVERAP